MYFGCIADDFTGAGDAASFLQKGGMRVLLVNGIPGTQGEDGLLNGAERDRFVETVETDEPWDNLLEDVDAVVIALKSRALEAREAADQTEAAARWLVEAGAEQIYIKYCSTFDSTEKGNIGPVCDRLVQWTGQRFTLLCPSLPANRRTVKDGILYVDGVPLAESPMRFHPVNPMKQSRIKDLMEMQSQYPCYEMGNSFAGYMEAGQKRVGKENPDHYYLIPDYETERDGQAIAREFGTLRLLTGGSGLCEALAEYHIGRKGALNREQTGKNGTLGASSEELRECLEKEAGGRKKLLILAGSCSKATRKQIEAWQQAGKRCVRIDPEELLEDFSALDQAKRQIREMEGELLVYSVRLSGDEAGKCGDKGAADGARVSREPAGGVGADRGAIDEARVSRETADGARMDGEPADGVRADGSGPEGKTSDSQWEKSSVLDRAFSGLALYGTCCGCERLIVAGGETSGAVTRALGYRAFYVGASIAPGVPVLTPKEDPGMRLVLKSGNFGGELFFQEAKEAIF